MSNALGCPQTVTFFGVGGVGGPFLPEARHCRGENLGDLAVATQKRLRGESGNEIP